MVCPRVCKKPVNPLVWLENVLARGIRCNQNWVAQAEHKSQNTFDGSKQNDNHHRANRQNSNKAASFHRGVFAPEPALTIGLLVALEAHASRSVPPLDITSILAIVDRAGSG
jgi:hypothetical protein